MKNWIRYSVTVLCLCLSQIIFAQSCANSGTRASDDYDCDGIINSQDKDADNDGILDIHEKCTVKRTFYREISPKYLLSKEGNVEYINSIYEDIGVNYLDNEPSGGSFVLGPYDEGSNEIELNLYVYKREGGLHSDWEISGTVEVFEGDHIYATKHWEHDKYEYDMLDVEKVIKLSFIPRGKFYIRVTDSSIYNAEEAIGDDWTMSYMSIAVKCDNDLDNDGNENWFDSDSDGDGCFDIFESGATDDQSIESVEDIPSFTSVGSNGFADNLELEADSGISKRPFDVLYKKKDSSKCANFDPDWAIGTGDYDDFDEDGIRNVLDLDADNDGVLNKDEETCTEETYTHIYDDFFWRQQINLSGTHINPSNPQEFLRTNIPAAATGFYCNPNNPNDGRSNGGTTYGKTFVRTLNDQPGVYYVTRRYVVIPNQKVTISYGYQPIRGRNFRQIVSGLTINNQRVDRFYSYSTPIVTRTVEITPTTQFLDIVMDFSSPGSCFADEAEISILSVSQELPRQVCGGNYDGDEYDNRYDLDSDNDGCYDFAESGLVRSGNDSLASTDIRFTGNGINGFADYAETDADNAMPIYPKTNFFLDSLFGNCSTCTDSIAPVLTGVPDDIDISCYKIISFDVSATDNESDSLRVVRDSIIFKTGEKVDSIQYIWSVTDDCENEAIDSMLVRYLEPSPISFEVLETSYCNQTILIDSLKGFEKYQTFSWTLVEGDGSLSNKTARIPNITFNSPDNFELKVTATDSLGCSVSKAVDFTVVRDASDFEISNVSEYCEGDTLQLQVNTTDEKVTWITPLGSTATGKKLVIEDIKLGFAGKYQAVIESSSICVDTISVNVRVNRRGSIKAIGADEVCLGTDLDLEMNNNGDATYKWLWNDSIISSTYKLDINSSVLGVGKHELILSKTPSIGCSSIGVHKIEIIENNIFSFPQDTLVFLNGKVEVNPIGFKSGIWTGPNSFSSFFPSFTISEATEVNQGTYVFNGLTNQNCIITDSFVVNILDINDYIPFFQPLNCEGTKVQLKLNKLQDLFKWTGDGWESNELEPIVTVEPGETNKYKAVITIDSLIFEMPLNVTTTDLLNIKDSIYQPTQSNLGEINIELDSSLSFEWLDDESASLNRSNLEEGLYKLLISNEFCTDTIEYEIMRTVIEDGSEEDGSEEDGSEEDGSEEDGSEEDGSEEDGSEEDGSEEDGSEDDGSEDDGSEEDGSEEDGSEDDGSEDDGSEDDGSGEDGSEDDSSEDDGSEEDGSEEDGSGEDGSEEDGSEDGGSEDDGSEDDGSEEDGSEDDGSEDDGSEDDGSEDDGSEEDGSEEDGSEEDGSEEDNSDDDNSNDDNSNDDNSDDDNSDKDNSDDEVIVYLNEDNEGDFCFDAALTNAYFTKVCENKKVKEISLAGNCLKLEAEIASPETVCYAICSGNVCDTIKILVKPHQEDIVLKDDYIKLNSSDRIILKPISNDLNLDSSASISIKVEPTFGNISIENKEFVYEPKVNKCGIIDSFVYEVTQGNEVKEAVVSLEFPCYTIEVKNGISPNGDGINDGLYIENLDQYEDTELTIFNRFGNKVFSQKNYQNDKPWKGSFKERSLPAGIYFYVFKVKEPMQKSFSGNLIISY